MANKNGGVGTAVSPRAFRRRVPFECGMLFIADYALLVKVSHSHQSGCFAIFAMRGMAHRDDPQLSSRVDDVVGFQRLFRRGVVALLIVLIVITLFNLLLSLSLC